MFRSQKSKLNCSVVAYNAWASDREQKNAEKAIREAIKAGSNPNDLDHRHFSALHWAAKYNWPQLIDVLMTAERYPPTPATDVNVRQSSSGQSPLHTAVINGSIASIQRLLHFGADATLEYENMSPVDLAIDDENEEVFEILVEFLPELAQTIEEEQDDGDDEDFAAVVLHLQEMTTQNYDDESGNISNQSLDKTRPLADRYLAGSDVHVAAYHERIESVEQPEQHYDVEGEDEDLKELKLLDTILEMSSPPPQHTNKRRKRRTKLRRS